MSDPTKNPEFQRVVTKFLTTPPKPHTAPQRQKRAAEKRAKTKKAPRR